LKNKAEERKGKEKHDNLSGETDVNRSGRKRMDKEYITMIWRDEDELGKGGSRRRRRD
jgi:hypothetical protein